MKYEIPNENEQGKDQPVPSGKSKFPLVPFQDWMPDCRDLLMISWLYGFGWWCDFVSENNGKKDFHDWTAFSVLYDVQSPARHHAQNSNPKVTQGR